MAITSPGVSYTGVLGMIFVTLKLVGVIDWSWWWVTLPLWGPLAVLLVCLVVLAIDHEFHQGRGM
jgi:membrane-bound ClpP family serine protease